MKHLIHNESANKILKEILSYSSIAEAQKFLKTKLPKKDLAEFGKRWLAARMLCDNKPYDQIEKATGFDSDAIKQIAQWLHKDDPCPE